MRDETYYYASGTSCEEQSKQIRFMATELVEQALENGYIVEACNLQSFVLVLDVIRRRELIPKEIWNEWKEEIFVDKLKVKEKEQTGKKIHYDFGISPEFRRSPHYWRWIHSVYPALKVENIGQRWKAEPYLFTDRSGKGIMLECLVKETGVKLTDISLDDPEVYEWISESVKFEGHPYLPDDYDFDIGILGIPGIGTMQSSQALRNKGKIHGFKGLVEVTREALSITEQAESGGNSCTITEAILQALVGYYMAWYYLYDTKAWTRAYQQAYMNPIYMEEWNSQSWDGDLLIEKEKKAYWERLLMLKNEEEKTKEEYQEYLTGFPMDIETVIPLIEKIWKKEGSLAIEEYGRLVLQGTYLDLWKWIYEEKDYQKDEILTQIACFAENDDVSAKKRDLFEAVKKYDPYAVDEIELPYFMQSEPLKISYRQRRRLVARKVEMERNAYLKELKAYSHSFTRFSIDTESASLFVQSTKEERNAYLRNIDCGDLSRALVLYQPSQRDIILGEMSPRLQNMILEDMKTFVKSEQFSLEECVEAEQKIRNCIATMRKTYRS